MEGELFLHNYLTLVYSMWSWRTYFPIVLMLNKFYSLFVLGVFNLLVQRAIYYGFIQISWVEIAVKTHVFIIIYRYDCILIDKLLLLLFQHRIKYGVY